MYHTIKKKACFGKNNYFCFKKLNIYHSLFIGFKVSPLCKNDNPSCEFWAQNGECEKNSGYMFVKCMKACNVCGNCYSFNRIT